jgi:cysteine-rich repeat protein
MTMNTFLGRVVTRCVGALVLSCAMASAAHAKSSGVEIVGLFAPSGGARSSTGASSELTVSPSGLQVLAGRPATATLRDVPLPDGGVETFVVRSFEVFTAGARIVETDGITEHPVAKPNVAFFSGAGVADPTNWIVLAVTDGTSARAIVQHDLAIVATIGPNPQPGEPRRHEMQDAASIAAATPPTLCGGAVPAPDGATAAAAAAAVALPRDPSEVMLEVEIGVDVGNSLYLGFNSNTTGITSYTANLIGAVSALYQRDVKITMKLGELTIWTSPESFDGPDTAVQLGSYASTNAHPTMDLAHYLNNHGSYGGRAYLPGVCGAKYGVSNIFGTYYFPVGTYAWDVEVVAHEMGHNLGSNHTHCYSPPLDYCYNLEPGCYSGPAQASLGETMSYCHLNGAIEMGFRGRVGTQIRSYAGSASCVGIKAPVCGDGIKDTGEQCDDGNTSNADCCSNTCVLLSSLGSGCDDGLTCTEDYACADSTCYHQPVDCGDATDCTREFCTQAGGCQYYGTYGACVVCGNGRLDAGEDCDDGNLLDGDCCSSTCHYDAFGATCDDGNAASVLDHCNGYGVCQACNNGVYEPGETCEDGNTVDGDCCSSTCQLDPEGAACDDGLACSTAAACDAYGVCHPSAGDCCGDGVVQPELGESCDDGNVSDDDCCLATCQPKNYGAECDFPYATACNPVGICGGNGSCYMGPSICDCCTAHAGPTCTDQACWQCVAFDEQQYSCSYGNWTSTCVGIAQTACAPECGCVAQTCGNGTINPGEQCDDGNQISGDCCSSTCQTEAGCCGNGTVNQGEQCDDGNLVSGDCCSSSCHTEPICCGDGNLDPGEQCDDFNAVSGDCCSATCQNEPLCRCGNGALDFGETCDDGNTVDGDCCSAACQLEGACSQSYKLYKAKTTKETPKFVPQQLTLQDANGSHVLVASKPTHLGNPSDVDGGGIPDATLHLECYKTKNVSDTQPNPTSLFVQTPLAAAFLSVGKATAVCMPTAKSPGTTTLGADRFRCSKVKGYELRSTVTVVDDFESKQTYVGKPALICDPAQATLGAIQRPERHLLCYKIKDAKTTPKQPKLLAQTVATQNTLGSESLTAAPAAMLCVPALIAP